MQGDQRQNFYGMPTNHGTWGNFGIRSQVPAYANPPQQQQHQQQQQQQQIDVRVEKEDKELVPKTWSDFGVTVQNISIRTYQDQQPSRSKSSSPPLPTPPPPPPPPQIQNSQQLLEQDHQEGIHQTLKKQSPVLRPNFSITIKVIDTEVVKYSYSVLEPMKGDWIGLYVHNQESSYKKFEYTDGKKEGEGEFRDIPNGYYDVRYMRGGESSHYLARSEPFLIGPKVSLKVIEKDGNKMTISYEVGRENIQIRCPESDWGIGIYPAGKKSNSDYLDFYKCRAYEPGKVIVEIPRNPGKYDARFFLEGNEAYSAMLTFEVENEDMLKATLNGNCLYVNWVCRTKPSDNGNWIGLYNEAEPNKCIIYKYIKDCNPSEDRQSGSFYFTVSGLPRGRYFLTFNIPVSISNILTKFKTSDEVRDMRIYVEL